MKKLWLVEDESNHLINFIQLSLYLISIHLGAAYLTFYLNFLAKSVLKYTCTLKKMWEKVEKIEVFKSCTSYTIQ